MSEYRRDIGNAPTQFQTITPKQKPNLVNTAMADMLGNFATGALKGFSSEMMNIDVRAATGLTVDNATVNSRVNTFEQNMQERVARGEITPENYSQMATEFLDKTEADAKTVDRLVKSNRLSSLHGEALVRRRISQAASNPFWAALGGEVQGVSGALGGGRDVARSAFATAEQMDLFDQAETERKAIADYRATVADVKLKTNGAMSEAAIVENIKLQELARQTKLRADATAPEQVTATVTELYSTLQQEGLNRIDPESKTIDAIGLQEIDTLVKQAKDQMTFMINTSDMSHQEKKEQLESANALLDGTYAMFEARSATKLFTAGEEEQAAKVKFTGSWVDPYMFYAVKTGNQELAKILVHASQEGREITATRLNHKPMLAGKMPVELANVARLFGGKDGKTSFTPSAEIGTGLTMPSAVEDAKTAIKEDPKKRKWWDAQGMKYPTETVEGILKGPMLKAANDQDLEAQEIIALSVNGFLRSLKAQALPGEKVEPIVFLSGKEEHTGMPGIAPALTFGGVVDMARKALGLNVSVPDHLQGWDTQIGKFYRLVEKSPWMWPEGTKTPIAAAEALLNNPQATVIPRVPHGVIVRPGEIQISPHKTYTGDEAVAVVEQLEGKLEPWQAQIVREEGYKQGEYRDVYGNVTQGVGQTGDYKGMKFKEVAEVHKRQLDRLIPDISSFPEGVQGALYASAYRGGITDSPVTIELINRGAYTQAADEFLANEEYKSKKTPPAIKARMERTANAIRSLVDSNSLTR